MYQLTKAKEATREFFYLAILYLLTIMSELKEMRKHDEQTEKTFFFSLSLFPDSYSCALCLFLDAPFF